MRCATDAEVATVLYNLTDHAAKAVKDTDALTHMETGRQSFPGGRGLVHGIAPVTKGQLLLSP